jgi:hypothetical protein
MCFVSFFSFKIVDHGGCWGNTAWALAQWRHLVAPPEATDALHQAMRHCTAVSAWPSKIASICHVFLVAIDFVLGHNHKLKTMSLS